MLWSIQGRGSGSEDDNGTNMIYYLNSNIKYNTLSPHIMFTDGTVRTTPIYADGHIGSSTVGNTGGVQFLELC